MARQLYVSDGVSLRDYLYELDGTRRPGAPGRSTPDRAPWPGKLAVREAHLGHLRVSTSSTPLARAAAGAFAPTSRPRESYDVGMPLLVASDLTKTYTGGTATVSALDGVSFALERGDFVALMGPSGCGKSTLLHLCGAMDRPSSGSIVARRPRARDAAATTTLTRVRRERIGFVFQFFNLLPTLTLADNIALPCLLGGMAAAEAEAARARAGRRA